MSILVLVEHEGGSPDELSLQALALGWLSVISTPTVDYLEIVPAFVVAGIGMGMFFAPIARTRSTT